MGASEEEVATLVRQSERILDAVLTEQLQKVQQKQNDILKEMLEVENLRDHIPLVRLQAQHVTKERRRRDASHLLVSVGFNFFLEMHLDEAEAFLKKKQDLLRKSFCRVTLAGLEGPSDFVRTYNGGLCGALGG
ncbi:hypothetical protein cyc_03211 [Cyclospora cayetanensis]|uniref:Prefoldin subunit n=1 Tax=Cyclospora cayetanensis TaxID=88456 RepID=A0A1D3D7C5_9EIME|nr:hypothetical protein cyc_03211 [Cyclospora cayetanensis]